MFYDMLVTHCIQRPVASWNDDKPRVPNVLEVLAMSGKTYRIGEAAAKLNLKTYVLRFWEMEFSEIAPIRTEKGQRLYREADLALLARIKYLLHERGLTIEGARRLLREEAARGVAYTDADAALPGLDDDMPYPESDEEAETEYRAPIGPGRANPPAGGAAQGSLFAVESKGGDAPLLSELSHIAAELAAIRDMLTF